MNTWYGPSDELEPRITPQPVKKFEGIVAPSVPEVSLILDKSVKSNNDYDNSKPVFDRSNSYSSWKKKHFHFKPLDSKVVDSMGSLNQVEHDCCSGTVNSLQNENATVLQDNGYKTSERDHSMQYNSCNCKCQDSRHKITPKTYSKRSHDVSGNRLNKSGVCTLESRNHPEMTRSESYNENKYLPQSPGQKKLISFNGQSHKINKKHASIDNPNSNIHKESEIESPVHQDYPYPCSNVNPYLFPHFYHPSSFTNHHLDNQDTVKNLLQLVNNQSEQIKTLQTQVDRLLKMQEENLKYKSKCNCSSQLPQNLSQSQNQDLRTDIPKLVQTNIETENDRSLDSNVLEQQSRKTLLEQKVSIGVMTSFEFTVQNNPFSLESEEHENLTHNQMLTRRNNLHLRDMNDVLRRNKASFTSIPSGHLENIVEDSESHISSNPQPSSHFNVSHSTKASQERKNITDASKESNICNTGSEKTYEYNDKNRNLQEFTAPHQFLRNRLPDGKFQNPIESSTDRNQENQYINNRNETNPCYVNKYPKKLEKRKIPEPQICPLEKYNHPCTEESLVFSGRDLNVDDRAPPSPEPSIHVEMQEYLSDDESDKMKRTSKIGWTFYNNVLGQVNQILQNSQVMDIDNKHGRTDHRVDDDAENQAFMDKVKIATLEQLRKLGINFTDQTDSKELSGCKKFDSSFHPRLDCQTNIKKVTSAITETNTSTHMRALAMKYLNDDQLAELAMQKQESTTFKHFNVQGTNVSLATMRYLERYKLLPGMNNVPSKDGEKICVESPLEPDARPKHYRPPGLKRYNFVQTPQTTCPSKILDISTLKQQPKLL